MVRHIRVRKKVSGSAERPRLCVFRSLNYIYAQVIDDAKGHTVAYASSKDTAGENGVRPKPKLAESAAVGKLVAERARAKGVTQVVFDRGGYKYHGRVKALAEAARAGGLEF
jgi:large subunit ribosomal protein L18